MRVTYGHAEKMRASVMHKLGRDFELGTAPWMEDPNKQGQCIGNPAMSHIISQYMISLRRRKVARNYFVHLLPISHLDRIPGFRD